MKEKGIIITSFGTSHLDTLEKTIAAVEADIAAAFPEAFCLRAFTSRIIRKSLASKGIEVFDVAGAVEEMKANGIKDLLVIPTHLICGEEYDLVVSCVRAAEGFSSVRISAPLLTGFEDVHEVLTVLDSEISREADEGIVFMGHGSEHWCNTIYAAMNYYAAENGFKNIFIGTVEAWPDLDCVVSAVKRAGLKKVILTPLMLVAGDHAKNDMAGEWAEKFAAEGITAVPLLRGLGEYAGIRKLYISHAEKGV